MATQSKKDPVFNVIYRTPIGKVVEAKVSAKDEQAAEDRIVSQGFIPVSVETAGGSGLNTEIKFSFGSKRVKTKDIAQWSRQFSTMFDAGLSVARILTVLAKQTEREKLREVTDEIRTGLEGGMSLADSMRVHVDVFGDLIVNMVEAGEIGGFLGTTFQQVATNLEADVKLRAKVKSAMTYPVIVLIMAVVMSAGMLIGIVPIFERMFTSMGGELPFATRMLVHMSDFLKVGIVPMIIAGVIFMFWWRKNKRNENIRNFVDPLKLRIPVFGKLTTKIVLSRFARNLGTLMSSGVPILRALDIVASTVGNVVISRALADVKLSVAQGESISKPLANHPVFPPMVVQMVAVGDDSGTVDEMLQRIANDYDQQVETTTEQLSSLIEPLMIAFLGVLVGGMVIALYMPIFSIYTLVQ